MKIGIDARLYQEAGLGRYIKNLLNNLQEIDHENEYFIFLLKKDFVRLEFTTNFNKVLADFRWYGFKEQITFPRLLSKYDLDLVHIPHFNVPILYKGKFIVTIHDLIHQHVNMKRATTHSKLFYNLKKQAYRKIFNYAVKKSQKIITISQFVKNQLIDEWEVDKNKIEVTLEAVDESLIATAESIKKQDIQQTLKKFGITFPFIFYIGNAHPHKNIEGLIKTFLVIRKRYRCLTLILAGDDNFFWQRIKKEYQHKDIIYTGKITDKELIAFYKSAKVFITASLEEGFGIPLLEAMACSCPVVSSNKGSLLEVGGQAAIYFDPNNQSDFEEKLVKVLDDKQLRKDLIEKGLTRVKQFSWCQMAKTTHKIYVSAFKSSL